MPYPRSMATFAAVTRTHILAALTEHDDRGADDFLGAYGFTATTGVTLTYEKKTYDAKAILAVAHRHATGRVALPEELADGKVSVGTLLDKRGFEVSGAARTTTARKPAKRAPRAAAPRRASEPEKPVPVCPTCYMALPATGVCDSC